MLGTIIKVVLALPEIIRAAMAIISFIEDQKAKAKEAELQKLKEDIKNAKSEDDFRNVADRL